MNDPSQNNQHPDLINLLLEDGLENAIPKISELLMNAAMLLERIAHIGADPNQEVVLLQELAPFVGEERAVGRDRVLERHPRTAILLLCLDRTGGLGEYVKRLGRPCALDESWINFGSTR